MLNHRSSFIALRRLVSGHLVVALSLVTLGRSTVLAQIPPERYRIESITLAGPRYIYTNLSGTIQRTSVPQGVTANGVVYGYNDRFMINGGPAGRDSWVYRNGTIKQVNLVDGVHEIDPDGGGARRYGAIEHANASGQVAGYSYRYSSLAGDRGRDAWVFDGVTTHQIGLVGPGYDYEYAPTTEGGGIYRYGETQGFNDAGEAAGFTRRFTAGGFGLDGLGSDAWVYSGATRQINPVGPGFEYITPRGGVFRDGIAYDINANGHVLGRSRRFGTGGENLGADAWIWNGTSATAISLTGSDYEYATAAGTFRDADVWDTFDDAGQVIGLSNRFSSSGADRGADAWVRRDDTTIPIGLRGSDYEYADVDTIYRYSASLRLNRAGQVAGMSLRQIGQVNSGGIDAWLFDGTQTRLVGLTGPGYEFVATLGVQRRAEVRYLNESGIVAGSTDRWTAAGVSTGRDAWVSDGATTTRINLTGPGYEYTPVGATEPMRVGVVWGVNDTGDAIGTSSRYTAAGANRGTAGWFYDAGLDRTFALSFSFRANDNTSNTVPILLTDDGVVLGRYTLYSGNSTVGDRAFWWSLDAGFRDLGTLVKGGLTAAQWSWLGTVIDAKGQYVGGGSPDYIIGTGNAFAGSTTAYLLTAVPEPAALVVLLPLALAARRTRSRESAST